MYIHLHIQICMYVYIYIYIYMEREREREREIDRYTHMIMCIMLCIHVSYCIHPVHLLRVLISEGLTQADS